LNIAMGGALGGSIAPNFVSAIMEIDYVRVYELQTQSIPVINSQPRLMVYPNPTQNRITVSSEDTIASLSIYAISGQRVFHKTPNKNEVRLTFNLPSGIYMIQAQVSGEKLHQKLIIE